MIFIIAGPWLCAATVRAVAHVSALTVMSTTHAPGEKARVVEVKDQRLSALAVSLLIGLSLFLSPLLKHIPYAVLFGVFLYMGISSMSGIQMFERIVLFIKPVKHHPRVNYVRRVSLFYKMYIGYMYFGMFLFCSFFATKIIKYDNNLARTQ